LKQAEALQTLLVQIQAETENANKEKEMLAEEEVFI
jgi:hypothetical protein